MAAIVSDWFCPLSEPVGSPNRNRRIPAGLTFLQSEVSWLGGVANYVQVATEILFPINISDFVQLATTVQAEDLEFVEVATVVNAANVVRFVRLQTQVVTSGMPFVLVETTVVNPGFGTFSGFSGS